jgi:hypothetical protein
MIKAVIDSCIIFGMPLSNYNIEAIHPDQFLLVLCDIWGNDSLYEIICQQSNALKNPRILPESLLDKLAIQKCLRFRARLVENRP